MADPTSLGISRRELHLAEGIAHRLPAIFLRRKLVPAFQAFHITRISGLTLFIAVLDTHQLGDHRPYTGELLHQISTDLGGLPVYLSNSTGLRYVILLSKPPKLPHRIELPGEILAGQVALGVRFTGEPVLLNWDKTPHLAVLGQTGSGKSVFLQSLAYQAMQSGMKLMISDLDQTTFGMLAQHPAMFQPLAHTPQATYQLIELALAECDLRAGLYTKLQAQNISQYNQLAVKHGQPTLPRILVILDEASAVLASMGGAKSAMGQALATLGWRGRKFGLHFVFAAQEFTKDLIGPVRDQVSLCVCFRVRSAEMAKRMNCQGAERIPEGRPGLAITDRYGPMQSYYLDPARLGQVTNSLQISQMEQQLLQRAQDETAGKVTITRLVAWTSASQWQARQWLEQWAMRGLVAKDPKRDNAYCLTAKTSLLLANQQTAQTAADPRKPEYELLKPPQTGLSTLIEA